VSSKTKPVAECDEEIAQIRKAQKDPQSFKPLYERYFKRIYLFVLHRIGDKTLSADITSQVFLRALLNIKKYKFQGLPFSAWLFRIALNECYDSWRKLNRHRFISIDDTGIEQLHEELTTNTELHDLQIRLPELLEKLSVEDLHLLELRFFEKRSFKEVADILDLTESNAKVRLYRLVDKMRRMFIDLKN
jgi:RNA polymerase sigma-70 factor, ECF subfamily